MRVILVDRQTSDLGITQPTTRRRIFLPDLALAHSRESTNLSTNREQPFTVLVIDFSRRGGTHRQQLHKQQHATTPQHGQQWARDSNEFEEDTEEDDEDEEEQDDRRDERRLTLSPAPRMVTPTVVTLSAPPTTSSVSSASLSAAASAASTSLSSSSPF